MTDIKYFGPDKDLTRFDYVKRSLLIIVVIVAAHFVYILKFSHRDISPAFLWIVDILIGGGLLTWTLTSMIVEQINLDFKNHKFTVLYLTVFRDNNKLEIPFQSMTFSFQNEPTRHQPGKWTLRVYDDKRKAFSIETNTDGFSKKTLEELAKHLSQIKQVVPGQN